MSRLLKLVLVFILLAILPKPQNQARASFDVTKNSATLVNATKRPDKRVHQLRSFLARYNSPLKDYADDFVDSADKYNVDWRLAPAIAGVESTFGRFIPAGSYNAYGWANGAYHFQSWPESIEVVNKTLSENYINRGADTVEKIAPIYAPPSLTWAGKVRYFMGKIESFDSENNKPLNLELSL